MLRAARGRAASRIAEPCPQVAHRNSLRLKLVNTLLDFRASGGAGRGRLSTDRPRGLQRRPGKRLCPPLKSRSLFVVDFQFATAGSRPCRSGAWGKKIAQCCSSNAPASTFTPSREMRSPHLSMRLYDRGGRRNWSSAIRRVGIPDESTAPPSSGRFFRVQNLAQPDS